MLHSETIAEGTLDLIKKFSGNDKLRDFTLVGGTALALQIGHRISVDIDLFSKTDFNPREIADHIQKNYPKAQIAPVGDKPTVRTNIDGVKTTFVGHKYPDVKPPETIEGVRMASLDDIAAMKINAIYNTGRRYKDFIDIYHILEHKSLDQILKSVSQKYPDIDLNMAKIALQNPKNVDLRRDQIEEIGRHVHWPEIKSRIQYAVIEPGKIFQVKHRERRQGEPFQRLRRKRGPGL